jgi:hypothetical protein
MLINVSVLGDLPEGEAKRYFCGDGEGGGGWAGLVAQRQAPPLESGAWAEVYAVCGGNMGLLKECVSLAGKEGSWEAGACRAAAPAFACASTCCGMLTPRHSIPFARCSAESDHGHRLLKSRQRLRRQGAPPARQPPGVAQYRAALRCVARAPHRAVRRSAMIEALNLDGSPRGDEAAKAALRSLVEYSLLALRLFSSWARDLPEEVYGEEPEAVVTMPGPAPLRHVLNMERRGQLEAAAAAAAAAGGDGGGGGGGAASG